MTAGHIPQRCRAAKQWLLWTWVAYLVISVAVTWPLARDFGTHLAGDVLDPWQTLWGFWWLRHAHDLGGQYMFSRLLWWPEGVPLWFQTWDLPSALAVWPLWGRLPEVALYNCALLVTFPLAGFTFCLLCHELCGSRLAAFLGGCIYTFSTYHFAHARMQLHLASMEWEPLYFYGLTRVLRGGRLWDGMLAGVALSLATLASIYHLLFAGLTTVILAIAAGRQEWSRMYQLGVVRRFAVVGIVFFGLAGWLLVGMARSYVGQAYGGSHDAVTFSADILSFVLPNAVSLWSRWYAGNAAWTGSQFESASYVGYVALGLAIVGVRRSGLGRGYLCVAVCGALLALGPLPHYGGVIYSGPELPEGWLERVIPGLRFGGLPVRFSWLTAFGVGVAAAGGLSTLCERGRLGRLVAVVLTCVSLAETWPSPFPMTIWPRPAIFSEWAYDKGSWAVLDGTAWSRALSHQMLHNHPIVAGYVTRTPVRLWEATRANDVLGLFLRPPLGHATAVPVERERVMDTLTGLQIRFLVVDEERSEVATSLGFAERYRGDGIVVFEVRR